MLTPYASFQCLPGQKKEIAATKAGTDKYNYSVQASSLNFSQLWFTDLQNAETKHSSLQLEMGN